MNFRVSFHHDISVFDHYDKTLYIASYKRYIRKQFFLFLHKYIYCGYSLAHCPGTSNEYPHVFVWRSQKHAYIILTPLNCYIVKLGFTGVYIILTSTTIYVLSRNMKSIGIFIWKIFSFWWWNFQYIWIGVFFVMRNEKNINIFFGCKTCVIWSFDCVYDQGPVVQS